VAPSLADPIDQLRTLLHELSRQWRSEGWPRERCAEELERVLEAYERGVLALLSDAAPSDSLP
jgi:hypothetical protein